MSRPCRREKARRMRAAVLAGVLGLSALPVAVAQVQAADLGTVTVTGTGSFVFTPSTVVGAVGDTITIKVDIQGVFLTPVIAGSTGRLLIGNTTCDSTQATCLAPFYETRTYTVGALGEIKFVENGGSSRVGTLTIAAPAPSTTSSTTSSSTTTPTTAAPPPAPSTTSTIPATSTTSTTSSTTTAPTASDDEDDDEADSPAEISPCSLKAMMMDRNEAIIAAPKKKRCISITGERGEVAGKTGIIVNGRTRGLKKGATVKGYVRFPGQGYTLASTQPTVMKRKFTWSRKTGKKAYVYFTTEDGMIQSNTIVIAAK